MTSVAAMTTRELVREFRETAKRTGTVFTGPSTPEKLKRTPERKALVARMQAVGAELRPRRPMTEIRAMFEDEDEDVRGWAAPQFLDLDEEWASATLRGLSYGLTAREVLALRAQALAHPPKGPPLDEWPIIALVERFEDAAKREFAARFVRRESPTDMSLHNRIVGEVIDVRNELIRRNALASLVPLLDSSNITVRAEAARATLPVAPDRASAALEAVVARKDQYVAPSAAETLRRWRERKAQGQEGA
jgi:hypothetical protein